MSKREPLPHTKRSFNHPTHQQHQQQHLPHTKRSFNHPDGAAAAASDEHSFMESAGLHPSLVQQRLQMGSSTGQGQPANVPTLGQVSFPQQNRATRHGHTGGSINAGSRAQVGATKMMSFSTQPQERQFSKNGRYIAGGGNK